MFIKKIDVSPLGTNCYIVAEDICKSEDRRAKGIVIDPGGDGEYLEQVIKENNIELKYVVLTHGHFDHMGAADFLKRQFNAEVLVHRLDAEMAVDPMKNMSRIFTGNSTSVEADRALEDGDEISLGELTFKVLHTPGHSEGGICLLSGESLFTGDTLFQGTVGRTDGPGGSMATLMNSLRTKLLFLDDDCNVYPGHGEFTTIGEEKRKNPYLRKL